VPDGPEKETNMNKYSCNGFRDVTAETMVEAAEKFAGRMARQRFGRRGYVRTLNQNAYAADGRLAEYSSFIGLNRGNETTGSNVNFTVHKS